MTSPSDPFSVIAQPPPSFSDEQAIRMVREHWGIDVALRSLVSERDQNYRITARDGKKFVLKIANAAEDPVYTDFQISALQHIENYKSDNACPVVVPVVIPDLNGDSSIIVDNKGERHVARIVTYADGIPLEDARSSDRVFKPMGAYIAELGRALKDFDHAGASQSLLWDLKSALRLRELLDHIPDVALRDLVSDCLDSFEEQAIPVLPDLRTQVIHNDCNPGNILVTGEDHDRPAGVIDFGDMLKSPLVFDLAVAAAYLRQSDHHPLSQIAELLAGYHSVTPLEPIEIDLLPILMATRVSTSITVLRWRESMRGKDDPYLENAASDELVAEHFLRNLAAMPRQDVRNMFRQVCASVDAKR